MMVWIHDLRSGADVLINPAYVSSVESDDLEPDLFHAKMTNREAYTVEDQADGPDARCGRTVHRRTDTV